MFLIGAELNARCANDAIALTSERHNVQPKLHQRSTAFPNCNYPAYKAASEVIEKSESGPLVRELQSHQHGSNQEDRHEHLIHRFWQQDSWTVLENYEHLVTAVEQRKQDAIGPNHNAPAASR